jgi:hypothetical protein
MKNENFECENCGNKVEGDLHTCPYKEELDNDYSMCNCCVVCRDACMDEI